MQHKQEITVNYMCRKNCISYVGLCAFVRVCVLLFLCIVIYFLHFGKHVCVPHSHTAKVNFAMNMQQSCISNLLVWYF